MKKDNCEYDEVFGLPLGCKSKQLKCFARIELNFGETYFEEAMNFNAPWSKHSAEIIEQKICLDQATRWFPTGTHSFWRDNLRVIAFVILYNIGYGQERNL